MEENIVSRARSIMGFIMAVTNRCKKLGLEVPNEEKMSEYVASVNDGEKLDAAKFVADYQSKSGVFEDKEFTKFKETVRRICGTVDEDKAKDWVSNNGYESPNEFAYSTILGKYNAFERAAFIRFIGLSKSRAVALWNVFMARTHNVSKSIYDLYNQNEANELARYFSRKEFDTMSELVTKFNLRYVQVSEFTEGNKSWTPIYDIYYQVLYFWDEIIEDIMLHYSTFYATRLPLVCDAIWLSILDCLGYDGEDSMKQGKLFYASDEEDDDDASVAEAAEEGGEEA
jgi:hypothetical protein